MVYYEPRVTQADKDHISDRLSKYVMDIRHDHELYSMALQWAARTYAAAQSYKKQKQIHRYLTTERHMFLGDLTLPEKPPVVGI